MSLKLLDTPINKQISKLQYLRGIRAGNEDTRFKHGTSEATRRRSTPLLLKWLRRHVLYCLDLKINHSSGYFPILLAMYCQTTYNDTSA